MTVATGLQEISHLIQSEAETLCCLDDPEHGDGLGRIEPMTAGTAGRLGEQAATFVVPQGLLIHPSGLSHLSAAHTEGLAGAHRPAFSIAATARSIRASRTSSYFSGTPTRSTS